LVYSQDMNVKKNESGTLIAFVWLFVMVYALSSKRGTYRGGKARSQQKTFFILFGKVGSYTYESGTEYMRSLRPLVFYTVPADVPHLIRCESYTWMIKWWNKDYTEKKFDLFYSRKK